MAEMRKVAIMVDKPDYEETHYIVFMNYEDHFEEGGEFHVAVGRTACYELLKDLIENQDVKPERLMVNYAGLPDTQIDACMGTSVYTSMPARKWLKSFKGILGENDGFDVDDYVTEDEDKVNAEPDIADLFKEERTTVDILH